jgi:hypothetical protein
MAETKNNRKKNPPTSQGRIFLCFLFGKQILEVHTHVGEEATGVGGVEIAVADIGET